MNDRKRLRGPKTKQDIITDILLIKKNDINGKLSAKDIREKLLKFYKGSKKYIPKERAIYNIINKNKDKVIISPLDSPWSIGCSRKYNIPADIIPTLIEFDQIKRPKFTIRQAIWLARLKPIVFEMSAEKRPLAKCLAGLSPIVIKNFRFKIPAPHNDSRLALLAIITYQYAGMEQLSELHGEQYPDTSDLDFTIFTEGNIGQYEPVGANWDDNEQDETVGANGDDDERGEPVTIFADDIKRGEPINIAREAFKSRFQTNTLIISSRKKKNEKPKEGK